MKCLVTGAAGFIGSNLVDELVAQGHKVLAIDNFATGNKKNLQKSINKIYFKKIDITDIKKLKKANLNKNIDWVFHLAGLADIVPSIQKPTNYIDTNVNGTLNILELFRNKKIKKFIYAASASCYGVPKKFPTTEKDKIDPQHPYALSKFLGEELVMHWGKVYNMPNISLRFFNVYGPRSRTTGAYGAALGVFLAQKLNNKPLTIVGSGNQTRDFIFIKDLIDAMIKAAKSKKSNSIFNLASGKEHKVNDLAKLISSKRVKIPIRPGEPFRSLASINKIKKAIKWKPKTSLIEGVSFLLKDTSNWKKAPLWTPKKIRKATKAWFKHLKFKK